MKKTKQYNSLFEKEMQKPSFRKKFEKGYPFFKIEVQLSNELEKRGITYSEFARAVGTQKGNISRDLKAGGIEHATLNRIKRMAEVLNCLFIPLIIPKKIEDRVLPRIAELLSHE